MARYIDIDKLHDFDCPQVWKSGSNCPDGGCAECFYNNGGAEFSIPYAPSIDIEALLFKRWTELQDDSFDQLYEKYEMRLQDADQKEIDAIRSNCKIEGQVRTEIRNIYYDFVKDLKSYKLGHKIRSE